MSKIGRLLRYDLPLHFVLLLTNWLPDNVPFLRLRGALVRPFLGSCGSNLRLARNITFHNPVNIHFGKNIFIAYGCMFLALDQIRVDDEVMFGPYCVITSGNHYRRGGSFRYGEPQYSPIWIGEGCWLGAHVVVIAGAEINKGSLIAAGAVVTKCIPQDVVAGGVPAHVIKKVIEG